MKKDIHPKYIPCKVVCVTSGKEIEVLSTKPELRIDISSFCHPFYTDSDKIVDSTGRVERFKQKYSLK
ncbi:MAG: 50S ribosomal protein L31 [Helicobacter sp.]|nr:50S ribosomal protein L31 [Helicobacter sp.]